MLANNVCLFISYKRILLHRALLKSALKDVLCKQLFFKRKNVSHMKSVTRINLHILLNFGKKLPDLGLVSNAMY